MIKNLTLLAALFFLSLNFAVAQLTYNDISYKQALKKARNSDNKIMIFFTLSSNNYCKKVEEHIFHKKSIIEIYNKNFINIKLDPNDKEGAKLTKKLNVNAYPSVVFINASEKIVHKIIGVNENTDMELVGNRVLSDEFTLLYYSNLYKKDPQLFLKDHKLFLDYINTLYDAGVNYNIEASLFFNSLNVSQLKSPVNVDAIIKYSENIYSPEFKFFAHNLYKIRTLNYKEEDKFRKLENTIAKQVIDYIYNNPKASPIDTLTLLFDYLGVEQREAIETRILLDYYNIIVKKYDENYFNTLIRYIPLHLNYLSSEQIVDYCTQLLQIKDKQYINEGIMWTEEGLNKYPNPDMFYARIQLLIRADRMAEARDETTRANELFGEENEAWNKNRGNLPLLDRDDKTVQMKIVK